jgi:hypothetical protein
MARKRKSPGSSEGEFADFVPAVFARSTTEAEEYRELLNDHDIPAIVETGEEDLPFRAARAAPVPPRPSVSRGVPILVPEALLDEASEILADRDFDEYRPPGDDDEEAGEEDEEEELTLDAGPRPAGSDADDEEPVAKPKPAESPFEDDEEAFVIDEDDGEEEEEEEEEEEKDDDDLGVDLEEEGIEEDEEEGTEEAAEE